MPSEPKGIIPRFWTDKLTLFHKGGGQFSPTILLLTSPPGFLDFPTALAWTYMVVENHWSVQKWGQKIVFFLSLWIFGTFQFFQSLPLSWPKLLIAIFGPLSYLLVLSTDILNQLWVPFVANIVLVDSINNEIYYLDTFYCPCGIL